MKVGTSLFILLASIILAAIGGWISNLLWIFQQDFSHITGQLVLAVIGVFIAFIGAIHGIYLWF